MKEEKYETEKICRFCEKATALADGDSMLCRKKGIVPGDSACRAFRYDPLKRTPHRAAALPEVDPEDMKL